jgi:hypothetical protein
MIVDYTVSSHVCRAPVSLNRRPTSLLVGVAVGVGGVLACNGKTREISGWTSAGKVTTRAILQTIRGERQAKVGLTDSAGVVVVTITERGVGADVTCSSEQIRGRLALQEEFDNPVWSERG